MHVMDRFARLVKKNVKNEVFRATGKWIICWTIIVGIALPLILSVTSSISVEYYCRSTIFWWILGVFGILVYHIIKSGKLDKGVTKWILGWTIIPPLVLSGLYALLVAAVIAEEMGGTPTMIGFLFLAAMGLTGYYSNPYTFAYWALGTAAVVGWYLYKYKKHNEIGIELSCCKSLLCWTFIPPLMLCYLFCILFPVANFTSLFLFYFTFPWTLGFCGIGIAAIVFYYANKYRKRMKRGPNIMGTLNKRKGDTKEFKVEDEQFEGCSS